MNLHVKKTEAVWRRFKIVGSPNRFGLSVAFAALPVVLIHANFEYGYDRFHPDRGHLYRLELFQDGHGRMPNFSQLLAKWFLDASAHIETAGLWLPPYEFSTCLTLTDKTGETGSRYCTPRIATCC